MYNNDFFQNNYGLNNSFNSGFEKSFSIENDLLRANNRALYSYESRIGYNVFDSQGTLSGNIRRSGLGYDFRDNLGRPLFDQRW